MIKPLTKKTVIAIVIGNALEWYDFIVYSFMTVFIANLFFPTTNPVNSMLLATATFGVAFFMRPIGGVVFGLYADKYGRKLAITLIMFLMLCATAILCLTPTYTQIGMAAPMLILFARLLQGFSAGGEFGISTAILVELAPKQKRGFYASWQMVGQMLAMLLGSVIGTFITRIFSPAQIMTGVWRVPFIFGLVIMPIAIYIRQHLDETHIDVTFTNAINKSQLRSKLRQHVQSILIAMGLVVGGTVSTYINISYMPTYVSNQLHLSMHDSFISLVISILVMLVLMPIFGWLSDHIGRKKILVSSIFLYWISIVPLFTWLIAIPTFFTLLIVQLTFCILLAAYFGVFAATVAELFPKSIRGTSLAISYNLTVMIFGGFAQFVVTWLMHITGSALAITYYLILAVAISLVASLFYRKKEMKTLEWLARLVACDTTSRNSNLQLIDLIKDWMFHHQIPIRLTHSSHEQKANLLATIPAANGDIEGGIILSGHTDVVPVDNQPWDTNPFEIVQKDGKVYGRGTADMKGFLAVMLALIPEFKQQSLSRPIHLAFSYDEEIGCKGAPLLIKDIEEIALKPYACIVGEPTMMQPIVAHKGIQVFRCRVHGQAVHSSLTTQGCNAIEYAAKLIDHLRNLADQFRKEGPFDLDYDVPFTSISTNMINGGIATNTIPALCEFMFEFRHLPQVSAKAIREQIENYIQKELLPKMHNEFAQGSIELEHIASVPAFEADVQSTITKHLLTLSNQQDMNKVAYATEAGLFEKAQIPTIICGPGNIEQAHRANEFVSLDQLAQCEAFLLNLVKQI